MGSYAQLKVADLEIAHFKSEIEPWIALVFTADDRRSRPATIAELDYYGQRRFRSARPGEARRAH